MLRSLIAASVLALVAIPAQAAVVDQEVPENAYISMGGLDWAWARPLPSGLDLSFQADFGWRLPTLEELEEAPVALDFIFEGANVPLGGFDAVSGAEFRAVNDALVGAAACAAPYFSTFRHCDWQDGLDQPFGPWAGLPGANDLADQLAVRVSAVAPIPVPASALLLLSGMMGLAFARKEKRA